MADDQMRSNAKTARNGRRRRDMVTILIMAVALYPLTQGRVKFIRRSSRAFGSSRAFRRSVEQRTQPDNLQILVRADRVLAQIFRHGDCGRELLAVIAVLQ